MHHMEDMDGLYVNQNNVIDSFDRALRTQSNFPLSTQKKRVPRSSSVLELHAYYVTLYALMDGWM